MKTCKDCKQSKAESEFYSRSDMKDGLDSKCKTCRKLYNAAGIRYSPGQTARVREYSSRPEVRARKKEYEQTEKGKATKKAYEAQPKVKKYHEDHRRTAENKASQRKYQVANPDKMIEFGQARRSRVRQADGRFTAKEWSALKRKYLYTCLCCGRREPEIKLSADHVVPLAKGGSNTIDNIQPLCKSCNSTKGTKTVDYRR